MANLQDEKRDQVAALTLSDKPGVFVEQTEYSALSTDDAEFMRSFTEAERRKVVRKGGEEPRGRSNLTTLATVSTVRTMEQH